MILRDDIMSNYEQNIKNYILTTYGNYLTPEKVVLLTEKNYSTSSNLLNDILLDLMEPITKLELKPADDSSIYIPYGESIRDLLVEFIAIKIANKLSIEIKPNENDINALNSLTAVDQRYFEAVERSAFTMNAKDIMRVKELRPILEPYANSDINRYMQSIQSMKTNNNYETVDVSQYASKEPVQNSEIVDVSAYAKPAQNNELVDVTNYFKENIISKEEYEALCEKYARGEELTKEELINLKNATMEYSNIEEDKQMGFTTKTFITYIAWLSVSLGFMILVTLFLS